jgi:pyrimidine 5'-nucleotidase
MNLNTIFFDLDSTLYPESNGMWSTIRQRIDLYMHERMGLSHDVIPQLRQHYFTEYGTTLNGLQANYNIDPNDYLNFVHDLPLDDYLQVDPRLRQMLLSIPYRRWIFTNSDLAHAHRVLTKLEIEDCFEGIIDIWTLEPYCKPQREAYQRAQDMAGVPDARACALLDDSTYNIATAQEMGFFTVLVGQNGDKSQADRSLVDLLDLPEVVPEFWS